MLNPSSEIHKKFELLNRDYFSTFWEVRTRWTWATDLAWPQATPLASLFLSSPLFIGSRHSPLAGSQSGCTNPRAIVCSVLGQRSALGCCPRLSQAPHSEPCFQHIIQLQADVPQAQSSAKHVLLPPPGPASQGPATASWETPPESLSASIHLHYQPFPRP